MYGFQLYWKTYFISILHHQHKHLRYYNNQKEEEKVHNFTTLLPSKTSLLCFIFSVVEFTIFLGNKVHSVHC